MVAGWLLLSSKTWGTHNYLNQVDITLGTYARLLDLMGPHTLAIHLDPTDPNVDHLHEKLHDGVKGFPPRHIRAVSIGEVSDRQTTTRWSGMCLSAK